MSWNGFRTVLGFNDTSPSISLHVQDVYFSLCFFPVPQNMTFKHECIISECYCESLNITKDCDHIVESGGNLLETDYTFV